MSHQFISQLLNKLSSENTDKLLHRYTGFQDEAFLYVQKICSLLTNFEISKIQEC